MKNFHLVLFVLIVTMAIVPSCNKQSAIGGELLEEDQLDIAFTDTISIVAKTITSDRIRTFNLNSQLSRYLCGDMDETVFGGVKATNYLQPRLSFTNQDFQSDDRVDSLILSIVYDSTGLYGNYQEEHTMNVYRLSENLENSEDYFSDDAFMFEPTPIGTKTFTPAPFTQTPFFTTYLNDIANIDTITPPRIRIPLDITLAQEILDTAAALQVADTSLFASDESFLDYFNGLYIEAEGISKQSMLSFQYRNFGSSLQFYYTRNDTIHKQYNFLFSNSSVKSVNFDHYGAAASTADSFLDNEELGDSLLFIQGMQGNNVSFRFPNIEDLSDLIINKATLQITVATLPGDDIELFEPVEQVLLSQVSEEGELLTIDDFNFAFDLGNISIFGGGLETDETLSLRTYEMNLSAILQKMVLGEVSDEVVLSVSATSQTANRSVIFGPNHSMFPAKLSVTYTEN